MMLRIELAFSGIVIPSASSTARTDVSAWVPVQTPQIRSVKAQASRGSRPRRMTSRPRHMVPVETALRMTPSSSTFTSQRMWPSIRVTGSTTIRWPALSSEKPLGVWTTMGYASSLVASCRDTCADLSALTAAWSATPPPTTPAAAMPTCPALASTPNWVRSVTRS
jgi:hypothetical protein